METTEVLPISDEDLRAWDWVAALRALERTKTWLARKTGKADSTVYGYAYGERPPLTWLREAYALLSRER